MQSTYAAYILGVPPISSLQSLSDHTSLSPGLLYKLATLNTRFYYRFELPKKLGGTRTIRNPSRDMKAVQAWILRNILDNAQVDQAATGFRKGFSVAHNAAPHVRNGYLLCTDIEDFFHSITYQKVFTVFRSFGYRPSVAHLLSSLCTCDGALPQGGVTSPALSNIVCIKLDRRITGFVGRRNIAYTRYADDLTFSCMTPNRLIGIMPTIRHILEDEGFTLNQAKTRAMGPRQRRRITGLVVGDGLAGVGKQRKRYLRAVIHHLMMGQPDADKSAHLQGWLGLLNSVDKTGLKQLRDYATALSARHGVANRLAP